VKEVIEEKNEKKGMILQVNIVGVMQVNYYLQ
jgi:hypothetical protein